MADAGKHHMNPDGQGKGSGTGAMTELPDGMVGDNQILKNSDKAQHTNRRGLDSKAVQDEQEQDNPANRQAD